MWSLCLVLCQQRRKHSPCPRQLHYKDSIVAFNHSPALGPWGCTAPAGAPGRIASPRFQLYKRRAHTFTLSLHRWLALLAGGEWTASWPHLCFPSYFDVAHTMEQILPSEYGKLCLWLGSFPCAPSQIPSIVYMCRGQP